MAVHQDQDQDQDQNQNQDQSRFQNQDQDQDQDNRAYVKTGLALYTWKPKCGTTASCGGQFVGRTWWKEHNMLA